MAYVRNLPEYPLKIDDHKILETAIKLYLRLSNTDSDYNSTHKTFMEFNNLTELPSLYQIKSIISKFSGVEPVTHDMCYNLCMGFTGPFSKLDNCSKCGEVRYNTVSVTHTNGCTKILTTPRKQFSTLLIGPQLQAVFHDPTEAEEMQHRQRRTHEIFEDLRHHEGVQETYNDFLDGSDYLEVVMEGKIKDEDLVLMFLIDGAQLYRNKQSDCWMSIWVVFNCSPDSRYKKKYVLLGVIIPGPNKPKNIDSFLFPGFHHVAALQHEGLPIWDALQDTRYI
ncbi:hypothetical protein PAXRUDRAFT_18180 [Paxillus rubicundulus Ve08.2h10]|uniref:Uncharacterized protein n=1 Tax=Paxillus rubicundulus Ve08.2h10 TaxID=930991 RepID=A0A0D0DFH7_9AGAM|nr:hypothetical protein PAXRUDRAFT_18180 [Paxillus rubicundulus Ve08.2h10]